MRRKAWALAAATALVTTLLATAALADSPWETADIFAQGSTVDVLVDDGAKIHRTATGVTASVTMPTPEPGTYNIPAGPTTNQEHGSPAAFSLWVFIFFNPEACDQPCDRADLVGSGEVIAGGFNAGGHLVSGPNLTISGRINEQSQLFGGPNAESIADGLEAGYTIAGAEIHVAVAPHGKLDPELLPDQFGTPAGFADSWWVAQYK
jgi:hypothetical protein